MALEATWALVRLKAFSSNCKFLLSFVWFLQFSLALCRAQLTFSPLCCMQRLYISILQCLFILLLLCQHCQAMEWNQTQESREVSTRSSHCHWTCSSIWSHTSLQFLYLWMSYPSISWRRRAVGGAVVHSHTIGLEHSCDHWYDDCNLLCGSGTSQSKSKMVVGTRGDEFDEA